jgi:hypothetical protein
LIPFAMPIPWRSSAEVFAQILRRHGVDPNAVANIETAWRAFGEFLQVEVDGIDQPAGIWSIFGCIGLCRTSVGLASLDGVGGRPVWKLTSLCGWTERGTS